MFLNDREINPNRLSPLTLAFIGDAVHSLYAREQVVAEGNRPVNSLHKATTEKVSAVNQCAGIKRIMDTLTETELSVFKRGRNASTSHTPKNASEGDYHYSTGFETLIGYLYLDGQYDRLKEILKEI